MIGLSVLTLILAGSFEICTLDMIGHQCRVMVIWSRWNKINSHDTGTIWFYIFLVMFDKIIHIPMKKTLYAITIKNWKYDIIIKIANFQS